MKIIEKLLKENYLCLFKRLDSFDIKFRNVPTEVMEALEKEIDPRNFLLKEYVNPIKLTRIEKVILESLPKDIKWIARDRDEILYIYNWKPYKENDVWKNKNDTYYDFFIFNHLFQFIQWEDEEPYSIGELLKCEVIQDE